MKKPSKVPFLWLTVLAVSFMGCGVSRGTQTVTYIPQPAPPVQAVPVAVTEPAPVTEPEPEPQYAPATDPAPAPAYAAQPQVSFNIFFQSLSPYGRWISYSNYGQVWIPNAGRGFSPYSTNGHWVYSDYGWTWVSDFSWGWAPFHYGRWLYDNYYGWVWVPGEQWGPAWVVWRNSPDYYGWAPLGPGGGISINIDIPAARWIFVPRHYFGTSYAYRYYLPRERNVTIIRNTTIINNTNIYERNRYYAGPSVRDVEISTRRSIQPVRIMNSERPGSSRMNGRELSLYRPAVRNSVDNRPHEIEPRSSQHTRPQTRPARTRNQAGDENNHGQPVDHSDNGNHGQPAGHTDNGNHGQPAGHTDNGNHGQPAGHTDNGNHGQPASPANNGNHGRAGESRLAPQPSRQTAPQAQPQPARPAPSRQPSIRSQEQRPQRAEPRRTSRPEEAPRVERAPQRSAQPEREIRRSEPSAQNSGARSSRSRRGR